MEAGEQIPSVSTGDALLLRLLDVNPGYLWATDRELRLTALHGRGLPRRGIEPADVVGKTLEELLAPDDVAVQSHRRALAGEAITYDVVRGEQVWRAHIEPLYGADATIEGVVGVADEISELAHTEEELDASRAKLDLTLAQLPAIFWATDAKLRLTSAAGRPISGRDIEGWIGKSLSELLGSDDHAAVLAHEEALRGSTGRYELVLDGRDYDIRVEPIHSHEDEIVGAVGIAMDVTEQREQRRTAEQLALVLRHSNDGISACGRDGRIFCWNPAAERQTGWPADEMIGRTTESLVPPEERAAWLAARAQVRGGDTVQQYATTRVRKDGTPFRVWLIRSPIFDEHGEVSGWVSIARDMEPLEEATERRQSALRLEAVGRLAAGIAHDFNNLLTAIGGYADVVRSSVTDAEGRAAVDAIAAATGRAVALTQGLLAFGQHQLLAPEAVDLNSLVRDAQPLVERLMGPEIAVELELDSAIGTIRFDAAALRQIVFDLALNARDAMPRGGTLSIKTIPADGAALLRIVDTGVGMDAATRERAFDPFFSTKEFVGGSGLGLAAVHGTVIQSGGGLRLESSPGGGTCIELRLPIETPSSDAPTAARRGGAHVLVVEDDEPVRRLVVQTLERAGYEVTAAPTAAHAVALVASGERVDLLLTDLVMPEVYGDELVTQIRSLRPSLPAIVMSGYVNDPRPAFPADLTFLPKPFRPGELVAAVERAL